MSINIVIDDDGAMQPPSSPATLRASSPPSADLPAPPEDAYMRDILPSDKRATSPLPPSSPIRSSPPKPTSHVPNKPAPRNKKKSADNENARPSGRDGPIEPETEDTKPESQPEPAQPTKKSKKKKAKKVPASSDDPPSEPPAPSRQSHAQPETQHPAKTRSKKKKAKLDEDVVMAKEEEAESSAPKSDEANEEGPTAAKLKPAKKKGKKVEGEAEAVAKPAASKPKLKKSKPNAREDTIEIADTSTAEIPAAKPKRKRKRDVNRDTTDAESVAESVAHAKPKSKKKKTKRNGTGSVAEVKESEERTSAESVEGHVKATNDDGPKSNCGIHSCTCLLCKPVGGCACDICQHRPDGDTEMPEAPDVKLRFLDLDTYMYADQDAEPRSNNIRAPVLELGANADSERHQEVEIAESTSDSVPVSKPNAMEQRVDCTGSTIDLSWMTLPFDKRAGIADELTFTFEGVLFSPEGLRMGSEAEMENRNWEVEQQRERQLEAEQFDWDGMLVGDGPFQPKLAEDVDKWWERAEGLLLKEDGEWKDPDLAAESFAIPDRPADLRLPSFPETDEEEEEEEEEPVAFVAQRVLRSRAIML
ncbi:hypothetical protein HMN09_01251500 [Mycena chlorophos]|uniref:Uncharacterized protein n=1 Tax=Mycena chlorophos TaxID=658473 RepID=A0A8H6S2A4_MYCCL|nr:hypothetical protein HMN09_01251500 [Mycena chlorophos]